MTRIIPVRIIMENTGATLAEKLGSEGERTLAYFKLVPAQIWSHTVFEGEGERRWSARDILEHLITSEEGLRSIFRNVAGGGPGVDKGFSIEESNQRAKGRLANLNQDDLFARFAECRKRTCDLVRGLSETQLASAGRHPFLGPSKLEDMLRLVIVHNSMHVKDVKKAVAQAASAR